MFNIAGGAKSSKINVDQNQKARNLNATLEFTQVPICRPWFDPGFFSMRAWTLDKLWDLNFEQKMVSHGGKQPKGRLVAYPITALFVRKVAFQFDASDSFTNYAASQITAGGTVGWGPFFVGGSYSHGSEQRHSRFQAEGGKVEIPDIQLIGFINNLIPKSPNPNPEIKPEQYVGGA